MKFNKSISLDIGLIASLEKLNLNVSEYCNEKLWNYIAEIEGKEKIIAEKTEDIEKKIKELNKKKEVIKKIENQKEEMKNKGITAEKIKFLKSMNVNIMAAKDMKMGWEHKFGEKLNWENLKELKKKWA